MEDEKNLTTGANNMGFLFKKISSSSTAMAYWLSIPEFKSGIEKKIENNETVDNYVVCDMMKSIYSQYEELREVSTDKPEFNYRLARRGIYQIERVIAQ